LKKKPSDGTLPVKTKHKVGALQKVGGKKRANQRQKKKKKKVANPSCRRHLKKKQGTNPNLTTTYQKWGKHTKPMERRREKHQGRKKSDLLSAAHIKEDLKPEVQEKPGPAGNAKKRPRRQKKMKPLTSNHLP